MGHYELADEKQDYHSCLRQRFVFQVLKKQIKNMDKVNLEILAAAIGQTAVVKDCWQSFVKK